MFDKALNTPPEALHVVQLPFFVIFCYFVIWNLHTGYWLQDIICKFLINLLDKYMFQSMLKTLVQGPKNFY